MNAGIGAVAQAPLRAVTAALCALAWAVTPVAASVVKCTDVDGNITYQDTPCERGQAGRAVPLPQAETRDDASAWEAAAKDSLALPIYPELTKQQLDHVANTVIGFVKQNA